MSRMTQARLAKLQKLAQLQSDAIRADLAPLDQRRQSLQGDVSQVRETLAELGKGEPEADSLVGSQLTALRYEIWCQKRLMFLQRELAKTEVLRAPQVQALGVAEARRMVMEKLGADQDQAAKRAKARQAEETAALQPERSRL